MTRRPVLPGAAELFRRTDIPLAPPPVTELPTLTRAAGSAALRGGPGADGRPEGEHPLSGMLLALLPGGAAQTDEPAAHRLTLQPAPAGTGSAVGGSSGAPQPARGRPMRARTDIGRARHDEKITVYCSADELVVLESARLTLRAAHGVVADRGRIVREAISVLLADLAEHGENSVLVHRLQGR